MHLGGLIISAKDSAWLAISLALVALVVVFRAYRESRLGPVRTLAMLLKILALLAIAFCFLEPLWSGQRASPKANLFAVVADNSESLQVKSPGKAISRGEQLREWVNPNRAGWPRLLEENFEVRRYAFDTRLEPVEDFSELDFKGRSSALGAALGTISERFQHRPLAGVLLFTDGNATDLAEMTDLRTLPPVYAVIAGADGAVLDVAVQQVSATHTAFEDSPVTVQAEANVTGCKGGDIVAQVVDSLGKVVAEQVQRARQDTEVLRFRFSLRPEHGSGVLFYQFRARLESELKGSTPEVTKEATLANNAVVVTVDRGRGPYRLLYVSGRPNWEFKFLNRAIEEDEQLELVALMRIAKREPRFQFLGRAGETSNPLYRGFGDQSAEEVERYDQPVMVRLNTRDESELQGGFPKTAEELFCYDAVILDDLEAGFFTSDQAVLLQKFVSQRGGGLLMLGGMESYYAGGYNRTPIGDMLPVYLDRVTPTVTNRWRLDLTREGWLQPWLRLRDTEAEEAKRVSAMGVFRVVNSVGEPKPGATVLATLKDEEANTRPALVTQRFGRGVTAALTIGDLWQWGFQDSEANKDMAKSWRQLMRWLVSDVPAAIEVAVEPQTTSAAGAVSLQVRARDQGFQPLENAAVHLEVRTAFAEAGHETNSVRLVAEPSLSEPGLYTTLFVPKHSGGYLVSATVTNTSGLKRGQAAAGWGADLASQEFRSLVPNTELLKRIAAQTGGQVLRPQELEKFVTELPKLKAPVMEPWNYPLWHTPAMLGFAVACLLGEWGLRRWKGMP